jgi:glycopeptide antibiotics resistance protein
VTTTVSRHSAEAAPATVDERPSARTRAARPRPFLRLSALLILLVYLAILAAVTLRPGNAEAAAAAGAHDNFTPFAEIHRSLASGSLRSLAQIVGNALLFAPFGILVPLSFPRLSIVTAVLAAAGASATVELVQLTHLAGRIFDVDDVILNVSGACVGGLLVAIWRGVAYLVRLIRR